MLVVNLVDDVFILTIYLTFLPFVVGHAVSIYLHEIKNKLCICRLISQTVSPIFGFAKLTLILMGLQKKNM